MSQDLENWGLLQELFHLAEETAAEERERVLGERCADTAMVRRALEIFEGSTVSESGRVAPAPILQGRVGSYTLLRLIGSGGIGSVYLAERMVGGAPQRFALKMLAPHAAGASFVDRFHREQHILGSLDHANITRMIDAGLTEAGQPYLVMEYVDGEHLDAYCDSRKLGIEERLRLFLHVCDAVAYAHRNLIVHLDLKPSNVLVSTERSSCWTLGRRS
jgi:serine/threonine protein kinase